MTTLPLDKAPLAERLKDKALMQNTSWEKVSPYPTHVGLWLDRCYVEPDTQKQKSSASKKNDPAAAARLFHHQQAINALTIHPNTALAVKGYRPFFNRWCNHTSASTAPAEIERRELNLQAITPLIFHQAISSSVTNGSMFIHHTYGVPGIPGAAIKGLLRHYGAEYLGVSNAHTILEALLGVDISDNAPEREAMAGFIEFSDALWNPELPLGFDNEKDDPWSPLARDILTPHNDTYYVAKGDERAAPDGMQNPVPVPYLVIRPGTRFRLVLECWAGTGQCLTPWLDRIESALKEILLNRGVGAKTNSGFGLLDSIDSEGSLSSATMCVADNAEAGKWLDKALEKVVNTNKLSNQPHKAWVHINLAEAWSELDDASLKSAVRSLIRDHWVQRNLWDGRAQGKTAKARGMYGPDG